MSCRFIHQLSQGFSRKLLVALDPQGCRMIFLSVDAMLGSQPASKFPVWSVQGKEKHGYLGMEAEASPAARERKEEEESTAKTF